jgi:hypothetical protein
MISRVHEKRVKQRKSSRTVQKGITWRSWRVLGFAANGSQVLRVAKKKQVVGAKLNVPIWPDILTAEIQSYGSYKKKESSG